MAQPLLTSTVGRRLLLRFVLAALLPMGSVALFAYYQVGDMLMESHYRRLQQDSRALGMSFVENLNWRARALQREATRLAASGTAPHPVLEGFLDYRVVQSAAGLALTPEQTHHLAHAGVILRLEGKHGPAMLTMLPGGQRLLLGRLDGQLLWHDEEAPEHYCVVSSQFQPLYCSPGLTSPSVEAWPRLLAQRHGGVFPWRVLEVGGDGEYLAAFWRARLQAPYAHPGIIVMVADSRVAVLRGLDRFQHVFPAIVVAALALALLLAINQIRRQLLPLERLTEGTRRLANSDFGVTVAVEGNDEFASLARAFNQMSGSLRHKFHLLQMLADLDRSILSSSEMGYLVQSVLGHIHQAIPCDCAGLVRVSTTGNSVFVAMPGEVGAAPESPMICSGVWECLGLDEGRSWARVSLDATAPDCLRHLFDHPLKEALLFPSMVNGHLDTLLILAYAVLPEEIEEIVAAGRSVADRLAVAASNMAWEEKLYHQAHFDALTDLPNRTLLRDRVEQALARALREGTSVGLMLLDLDSFKQVNDSLGHSAGDALLLECAQRLRSHIRLSDTVARLGGDEFILLVPELARGSAAGILEVMARKLNDLLIKPVHIMDRQIATPVSIGIALYPDNAGNFEELLKMADAAMYESKRQQPGGFRFYSTNMNDEARARFELVQDLREAITRNELLLHYQPKVALASRRIIGAEALVRWNSPKRGLVSPGVFIPVLDRMGLDDWLSDWVLETACAQMAVWNQMGLPPFSVSINVSPAKFQRGNLPQKVRDVLDDCNIEPRYLELEILETTEVTHSVEVRDSLARLRAMGINIALDDFGTGYSSLVYLTQVPANILKIDRAFIQNLTVDTRQQAIVGRIIALAKALDFCVVAEGVEEPAQMELLAAMDCDLIQGYLISRPLPADAFVQLLRTHEAGLDSGQTSASNLIGTTT